MKLPRLFRIKKTKARKYPIQRDDRGRPLRERCFECFNDGMRLIEVMEELDMKKSTAYTYFRDWKKRGPDFKKELAFVRGDLLKKDTADREYNLGLFSRAFGISKEELENILSKPYGLQRLLEGKFRFPAHADADRKRQAVLEVALFIDNYLTRNEGKIEDILFAFEQWMKINQQYREEEDADIKEENQEIALTREVLAAFAKAEREGRPKRDRFTEEELDAVIKYGLQAKLEQKLRGLQADYWFRVVELMADEKLTMEQAREKICQDLIDKGDVEGAKLVRKYQDRIHPLKSDNQTKPPPPSKPPLPA